MKTGIIDVGGGYRGIYAAGVIDYFMDHQIHFDMGIGVSAGSANLISYAAEQPRRNYQFYAEYGLRKEYASVKNFLTKKSFIDLNYVYSTLSNSDGENPLDYTAFSESPMELFVVATNAQTGEAVYFNRNDVTKDNYDILKASCSIPFVCPPYQVKDSVYYDGALSDPIPFQKAFESGCDKVVVLLTKPVTELRTPDTDKKLARMIRKKYPIAAEKLCQRAQLYNDSLALCQKYAESGKLYIIAPDDTCGVNTLTRDFHALASLYQKGYQDGRKINDFF